ncbi:MAG: tRNA (adenosine(37)-N6)-threonylcarbamoyltransferase complex transferase subunit TsaD [Saprospiraceae bacterium]|nr:tRNA (adenosine(37)-N6)-threonylcarbamoyltransferase complex transferase subunit TsaD [Saprospiraceae bacterium]MBL0113457.1 tRNA (adenosine(37)-N6)-threonylcarbamoyltransferase complex transferase subunit TsaD [Saprospiraceae bacterium]
MTKILAIESSCDETSVAVIDNGRVISNLIANQTIHSEYGGVVPELASRSHQENIIPVTQAALHKAQIELRDINGIAVTTGPGLMGALLVGVCFAKSLAYSLKIPLIEVNHMQAHILAHFAEAPYPNFPFLCLTVSGGHTQIVLVRDHLDMEIIGQTLDDAVGEAFDKGGKIFGLGYPAGPVIDSLSKKGQANITLPEPQVPGLDFSFSGIKTAVLYHVQAQKAIDPAYLDKNIHDLCASLQSKLVDILMKKLVKAADIYGIQEVAIAGGVSANSALRHQIISVGKELGWKTYIPKFEYCTDNAAMIGIAAHYKFLKNQVSPLDITPHPRLPF